MTISVRHQARILIMQVLYEWDSADHDPVAALERHLRERGVAARVAEFARSLLGGVQAHLQQIDDHLAVAAPQRPLTQMARVEKAILRLAIFEILYNNNAVPSRAAINEAIELAKTYGSENSGRFVNGVLGTIFSHAESSVSDNTTSRK